MVPAACVRLRGRRELLLVVLVFGLLAGLFLWRPLLAGPRGVFLPNDIVLQLDLAYRGPQAPAAQNDVLSDVSLYYYPYVHYSIQQTLAGHIPLWNPLILAGSPFHATAQAALFDPINLLTRPAGEPTYWVLAAWLRLMLAGMGVYALLRALGRGSLAGLAGGVVFMYSGFIAVWLNYSVVTTVVWLPAVLWATLRLAQTGRPAWIGLLAFFMAAQFYGGHPETSFIIGLTWAAYALFLTVTTLRRDGAPAARGLLPRFGGAAALGIAAGMAQLLPMLDMIDASQILASRSAQGGPLSVVSPVAWLHTLSLFAVSLVPNLSGTPTQHNYWYIGTNFNEQTSYCGLLALGLAGVGLFRRRQPHLAFFALAGLLAWGLLIHLPGLDLLNALPGFNVGAGVRWAALFSLCVAVLAGIGLETLVQSDPARLRRTALAWIAAFGLPLLGVLLFYAALRFAKWHPAWGSQMRQGRLISFFSLSHMTLYWPFLFAFSGLGLLLLLLALGRRRGGRPRQAAGMLLLALLIIDGITFGSSYNTVIPASLNLAPTPLTRWLAGHLGSARMTADGPILLPNLPMLFGLRDLRGYEDLASRDFVRTFSFASTSGGAPSVHFKHLRFSPGARHRLDMAGVRYFLTNQLPSPAPATQPAGFVARARFSSVQVYENTAALPRAYGVYQAALLPAAALQARLDSPSFDPHTTVLLENTSAEAPAPAQPPVSATPQVSFISDEAEHVALFATFARPGYLVLADTWADGWEARVDGTPAPILRANGIFRAVALPAGAHTVTFDYRPPLVYAGAAISLLALLIIGALLMEDLLLTRISPRLTRPAPPASPSLPAPR